MHTRLVYVDGAYCYNVTMLQCYKIGSFRFLKQVQSSP